MPKSEPVLNPHRLAIFQDALKQAGVKLTHQRLEIFRELANTAEHPDAETIFRAVQERVPMMSLDTVYRTLWMLRDLGLIKTLGPNHNAVRFDANLDPHHHYVCVSCGSVRDFQSEELNKLPLRAVAKRFGSVVEAQVEVRGLCASCQGTRPSGASKEKSQPKERANRALSKKR